jgi:ribonuclease BN (tRNA processing enzyme)
LIASTGHLSLSLCDAPGSITVIGWGHSTWQQGIRLAQASQTKLLAIFHHDPGSTDTDMDNIQKLASQQWAGAFVAREGESLML